MGAEYIDVRVNISLKATVFCALSKKAWVPLFSTERTLSRTVSLDTLQNWLMPQVITAFGENLIFLPDGVPHHYPNAVSRFLIGNLPGR
jgi:hypothetical protein